MNRFDMLPELISAKTAREILGIRDKTTWTKLCGAAPQIVCKLPGLNRPKYRKGEIQKLLRTAAT